MILDEAIKHCDEVAEGYEEDISKWKYTLSEYRKRECVEQTTIPRCEKALNRCKQCASEHRQLAEWLKDYKRLKEQEPTGHWIIIDDCEKFIAKCSECGRIEDSRMISKYPYCHCGARMVDEQERIEK